MSRSQERRLDALEAAAGDAVERQGGGFEQFAKYRPTDLTIENARGAFDAFCRDQLDWEPFDAQLDMAARAIACPRSLTYSSNSFGKDACYARVALFLVYVMRFDFGVLTGNSVRQVRLALFREFRRAWLGAPALFGELLAMELRIDGEPKVVAFVSHDAERLVGLHEGRMFLFITEAQGCPEAVFEAAAANLSSESSRFVVYGNPTRPHTMFHQLSQSPDWEVLGLPASRHPNVVAGEEVIPGGITRSQIAAIESMFGPDHPATRARVHAEWPTTASDALVEEGWIEPAVDRWRTGALEPAAMSSGRGILGVDPARFGADATAVAIYQPGVLYRFETWHGADTVETAGRVHTMARRLAETPDAPWGAVSDVPAVVDEPGIGSGVIDEMRRLNRKPSAHHVHIIPFNGWTTHPQRSRWRNDRAEAAWLVREGLRQGELAIPGDELLIEELLKTTWSIDNSGSILLESKDDLRPKLKRSPDRMDALAMACFGVRRVGSTFRWKV